MAGEHVSTQDTLSREHVSTQDTLSREHVSTQGTVARGHVSTQGTLPREHVRHAIEQTQGEKKVTQKFVAKSANYKEQEGN